MSFRVLVAGSRDFHDFPRLRAALEAALVNRLSDVVILTGCGPGADFLAASYATARGLAIEPYTLNVVRFPNPQDAAADRAARLVAAADAAVIVFDGAGETGPGGASWRLSWWGNRYNPHPRRAVWCWPRPSGARAALSWESRTPVSVKLAGIARGR